MSDVEKIGLPDWVIAIPAIQCVECFCPQGGIAKKRGQFNTVTVDYAEGHILNCSRYEHNAEVFSVVYKGKV